jgi:hypothetical protein
MPARKPTKLLLLNGRGDGKDSAGRPVPLAPPFKRQAPEPPSWLSREARAEWRRIVPELERLDLVKPADRAAPGAAVRAAAHPFGRHMVALRAAVLRTRLGHARDGIRLSRQIARGGRGAQPQHPAPAEGRRPRRTPVPRSSSARLVRS